MNHTPPASCGALLMPPTTHSLRIYAQQMQQTHRMTPDRDAKSAISGRDIPLPKLNVAGSIPFTRFHPDHASSPSAFAGGGLVGGSRGHGDKPFERR